MRRSPFALAAFLSLVAGGFPAFAGGADAVVAERGTDQVTALQARALIAASDEATRQKLAADPAALTDFLRNYLLERAVLAEARAQKWDTRADVATLAQLAHDKVIAQSFLASKSQPAKDLPSDSEIHAAYDQNKAQLLAPRSYHLAQVYIATASGLSQDDARQKLSAMRGEIRHGRVRFEEAAKSGAGVQYADLGWIAETRLASPVKAAVSGLLEGQISDVVCTTPGCTVIQLMATRPAGPAAFADVREGLVRLLRQQREQAGERAYADQLLAKSPVRVDEIQLSRLTGK